MDVCSRCKYNKPIYYCLQCLKSFCSCCDTYIHSLPSYQCHKRNLIDACSEQKNSNFNNSYNTNFNDCNNYIVNSSFNDCNNLNSSLNNYNVTYNSNCDDCHNNISFTEKLNKKCLEELKVNCEKEKECLKQKICQLNEELNNTKKNFQERFSSKKFR